MAPPCLYFLHTLWGVSAAKAKWPVQRIIIQQIGLHVYIIIKKLQLFKNKQLQMVLKCQQYTYVAWKNLFWWGILRA